MALETAVDALRLELARLEEAVAALHVTVAEDAPPRDDALLVDRLDMLLTDLTSTLEEASARLSITRSAVIRNAPPDELRAGLHDTHVLLNRFAVRYACELAAYGTIAPLLRMGRERGRPWWEWSEVVRTAVDACAAPLSVVLSALVACWSELSDRLARTAAVPCAAPGTASDAQHPELTRRAS